MFYYFEQKKLSEAVREEWNIESMDWILDVYIREDDVARERTLRQQLVLAQTFRCRFAEAAPSPWSSLWRLLPSRACALGLARFFSHVRRSQIAPRSRKRPQLPQSGLASSHYLPTGLAVIAWNCFQLITSIPSVLISCITSGSVKILRSPSRLAELPVIACSSRLSIPQ